MGDIFNINTGGGNVFNNNTFNNTTFISGQNVNAESKKKSKDWADDAQVVNFLEGAKAEGGELERKLPKELDTPQAREMLEKLQKAGYLDEQFRARKKENGLDIISGTEKAMISDIIADKLEMKKGTWYKVFAEFWNMNRDSLRSSFYKSGGLTKQSDFIKMIKKILE